MSTDFERFGEKLGFKGSQADPARHAAGLSESQQSIAQLIARVGISLAAAGGTAVSSQKQGIDEIILHTNPRSSPVHRGKSDDSFDKSAAIQVGWNGFKFTLNVLKEVSVVFPPLEAAVGALITVIEKIDITMENHDNFKAMIEQLKALAGFIERYKKDSIHPHVRDRLEGLAESIKNRTEFIKERMERGKLRRFINSSDDAAEIVGSLRELTFAVQLFQMDSTENTRQVTTDLRERELLKILDAVSSAAYYASGRSGCMDGTRLDILSRLFAWAADPSGERVLWLSGMAGVGKSAIALSFCKAMAVQGSLGGSFFCSRQSELLNDVKHILPTIAFQLARRSDAYRQALVQVMEETSYMSYSYPGLDEQAKDLFIDLLAHLKTTKGNTPVVVIDALDECSSPSTVKDFLRVVLRSDLPLKFLITSRPEAHIEKGLSRMGWSEIDEILTTDERFRQDLLAHASIRLHDVETDLIERDIHRYLTRKLSTIFDEVDKAAVTTLVKRSNKRFIYASTAVQYISAGADSNLSVTEIKQRFSVMIGDPEHWPAALSMLDIGGDSDVASYV